MVAAMNHQKMFTKETLSSSSSKKVKFESHANDALSENEDDLYLKDTSPIQEELDSGRSAFNGANGPSEAFSSHRKELDMAVDEDTPKFEKLCN